MRRWIALMLMVAFVSVMGLGCGGGDGGKKTDGKKTDSAKTDDGGKKKGDAGK